MQVSPGYSDDLEPLAFQSVRNVPNTSHYPGAGAVERALVLRKGRRRYGRGRWRLFSRLSDRLIPLGFAVCLGLGRSLFDLLLLFRGKHGRDFLV